MQLGLHRPGLLKIAPVHSELLYFKWLQIGPVPGHSGLLLDALTAVVCFQIALDCSGSLRMAIDTAQSLRIAPAQLGLLQLSWDCSRSVEIVPDHSGYFQDAANASRLRQSIPDHAKTSLVAPVPDHSGSLQTNPSHSKSLYMAELKSA